MTIVLPWISPSSEYSLKISRELASRGVEVQHFLSYEEAISFYAGQYVPVVLLSPHVHSPDLSGDSSKSNTLVAIDEFGRCKPTTKIAIARMNSRPEFVPYKRRGADFWIDLNSPSAIDNIAKLLT